MKVTRTSAMGRYSLAMGRYSLGTQPNHREACNLAREYHGWHRSERHGSYHGAFTMQCKAPTWLLRGEDDPTDGGEMSYQQGGSSMGMGTRWA